MINTNIGNMFHMFWPLNLRPGEAPHHATDTCPKMYAWISISIISSKYHSLSLSLSLNNGGLVAAHLQTKQRNPQGQDHLPPPLLHPPPVRFICLCRKTWVSFIFVLLFSTTLNRSKKVEWFKYQLLQNYCYGSWAMGWAWRTPCAHANFYFDFIWFLLYFFRIFCWVWPNLIGSDIVYLKLMHVSRFSQGLFTTATYLRCYKYCPISYTLSTWNSYIQYNISLFLCLS